MKTTISAAIAAIALLAPIASFAQSNANTGLTRAQVKAELVQLEAVGYNQNQNEADYPRNIQSAEARVHQNDVAGSTNTAVGADLTGSSRSGRPMNQSAQ
jgi:hypothetical protein